MDKTLKCVEKEFDNNLKSIEKTMDKIQDKLLWEKVCSLERKMDKIIEMLGDRNAKN